MQTVLNVFHLFLALGLIGLVLIQHGKGADAGAAFGSGASATVFGARGSGSFLTRATGVLATLFFLTSMALAYFASQTDEPKGLMEGVEAPAAAGPAPIEVEQDVPAAPGADGGSLTDVPAVPTGTPAGGVPRVPEPVDGAANSGTDVPATPNPSDRQGGGG